MPRRPPTPIPPDVIDRVRASYGTGLSVMEIAFDVGVHELTVRRIIKEAGLTRPYKRRGRIKNLEEPTESSPPARPALTAWQAVEIARHHARGLALTKIAALMRCTYREVIAVIEAKDAPAPRKAWHS